MLMFFIASLMTILFMYAVQIKFKWKKFVLMGYLEVTEFIVRTLLITPAPSLPRSIRMRIIIGPWLVCCVFIAATIQTNFIANLAKPGIESQISTQEELLHSDLKKVYSIR